MTDEELRQAEAKADARMMRLAIVIRDRAIVVGHVEAQRVCERFINGDDSAGDDIQQGMRSWGL